MRGSRILDDQIPYLLSSFLRRPEKLNFGAWGYQDPLQKTATTEVFSGDGSTASVSIELGGVLPLITHTVPGIGKGPILDFIARSFAARTAVLYAYPLDLVRAQLAYQFVGSKKLNMQGLATGEQFY
ncbi:hypothetical protein R3W88_019484 [Solanum pinnatisectum]|uniref:Uncharacterized protein n=1 Tax=Solanum pinnatisectum TaxID=50273 RepID=A0AAV9KNE3_9SOLN|nr:hypothetical protein R3W88_019484 [Solanum pinnatisectum]